jgi:hypothetical protein
MIDPRLLKKIPFDGLNTSEGYVELPLETIKTVF